MFLIICTLLVIIMLILTNAITDAPNAICTLVGTKVMPFKKAARLSALFNVLGIIIMSLINISVADTISNMINLNSDTQSLIGLISAILSVVFFAYIALCFGIPTSETHALVASLTGSAIALYGTNAINLSEWKNVIIGLVWSVIGTYIISKMIQIICKNIFLKPKQENKNIIKRAQIYGMYGMSFMHGAQDGQKFIGVLILLTSIIKGVTTPDLSNPFEYIEIIVFVAIIMYIGVSIGGKKIVDNIGKNMTKLDNSQALLTDISTAATLLIASITGLPVSTTHVKTVSIISISKKEKLNKSVTKSVIKAWIYTFPICFILAYMFTIALNMFLL